MGTKDYSDFLSSGLGGAIPMIISRNGGIGGLLGGTETEEEKRRKEQQAAGMPPTPMGVPRSGGMKKGGKVKAKSASASKRADGVAQRGKTRGRFV